MATISKEKGYNRWLVQWVNPLTKKQQKKRFKNKPEAEAVYKIWVKTEALVSSGFDSGQVNQILGVNTNMTIKDVFEWHYENYSKRSSEKTDTHYKLIFKAFKDAYGENTPVSAINTLTINKQTGINIFISDQEKKGNSQTTINNYLSRGKTVFDRAVTKGVLNKSPITKDDFITITEYVRVKKVWSDQEVVDILTSEEIPMYYKEVFILMVLTGMRLSEICGKNDKKMADGKVYDCGFTWDDVYWDEKAIIIKEKSQYGIKPSYLPITALGIAILRKWRDEDPPEEIYGKTRNRPVPFTDRHIINVVKKISAISGISFTVHDIRRLSGQRIVELTGNLIKAKKLYGHSSVAITEKSYVAYKNKDKVELAEILADDVKKIISNHF